MKNFQEIENSKVILRVDYNVPVKDGQITDFTRIQKSIPTIQTLLSNNNQVVLCSHLGRPNLDEPLDSPHNSKLSFQNYISQIQSALDTEIKFVKNYPTTDLQLDIQNLQSNQLILLENTRFFPEEKSNDPKFSKNLAQYFDYFVFDAFGTAHRKHATTYGLTQHLPSCFGQLVETEIQELDLSINNPQEPLILILGGAKIKTKIGIIETFLSKASHICIGGALANTFLYAVGYELGQSLVEKDELDTAIKLINKAKNSKAELILPIDLVTNNGEEKSLMNFTKNDNGLDIGPLTNARFLNLIKKGKTIIFNGPMGVYQDNLYSNGTESVLKTISQLDQISILGGGDTLDAIRKFAIDPSTFTHVSTGGGAMLKYLETEGKLPVLEAIQNQS